MLIFCGRPQSLCYEVWANGQNESGAGFLAALSATKRSPHCNNERIKLVAGGGPLLVISSLYNFVSVNLYRPATLNFVPRRSTVKHIVIIIVIIVIILLKLK